MTRHILPAVLAVALALPAALSAQQIGTVASSEPTLRGTPPGAGTRTLDVGSGLVQDETVQSSAAGRGQLLFVDQSTLSLAPNTTIVLDRFVFDPASGAGEVGLQLTQGALRFIGGTLSRQQEAVITTPTASIGIRGSTALVLHQDGRTIAVFVAGQRMCIIVNGTRRCTSRQGGVLTEEGYIGRVSPAFLASLITLIDGAPGIAGSGTGAPGTGIGGPNPNERGPVSTTGEEFDPQLFEDDLTLDTIFEFFGNFIEEEGGGSIDPCEFDPTLCG
jgi:hypothetical protein